MENFVGYVRVSTLKQTEGHSVDVQREKIQNYCKLNDINLVKIFSDDGISAIKNRPAFTEAMDKTLNDAMVNGIITYDFFRFARSVDDLRMNIFKLQEKNKRLISLKENFDMTGKFGKLIITIIGAIAEFERETILDRMQSGKEWAKIHGTKSKKPMHRPQKEIDWSKVRELREKYRMSWTKIAPIVGVTTSTIISRAKKEGIA